MSFSGQKAGNPTILLQSCGSSGPTTNGGQLTLLHSTSSLSWPSLMGFPSTVPGLLPGGHLLQSCEYNVLNNSHPVHGERQINHIPQGENSNANSHNSSSGWSSGFTLVLHDLSLDHSVARPSSPRIKSTTKVSHNSNFQQIYVNSRDIM